MNTNLVSEDTKQALPHVDEQINSTTPYQEWQVELWKDSHGNQVLEPVWAFGFNENVPVINLCRKSARILFYSSAHLVILYFVENNRQYILRGHCNEVTCLSSSGDRRWLASGDAGPDSAVIIWDCKTGEPVRTMLSPHANGVYALKLTEDARYLATLSAEEENQELAIWNWTSGSDKPMCLVHLDRIHSGQKRDKNGNIKAHAPILTDDDFKRKLGNFTHTNFIPETTKAITATSQGLLIVWENASDEKTTMEDGSESLCKKATKLVPIHERPITFMTITRCKSTEYCIVTGDMGGHIKFFDTNFLLIYWYQDINAGPIKSISFARRSILDEYSTILQSTDYPECSTIPGEKFVVEDFVVATAQANLVVVTVDGGVLQIIMQDNHDVVTGLSVHPNLPHLATVSFTGHLTVFNYDTKSVIGLKRFGPTQPIQTCKYDPNGNVLALGFVDGQVHIVDSITLASVTTNPFDFGKGSIEHIAFERHAEFCAYSDASFAITLLRVNEAETTEDAWVYVGRVRAHSAKITDILFWKSTNSTKCRLFTLGEDRNIVEYDIYQSSLHNVPLLARYRVEQLSKPLCMSDLPNYYKEDFICLFSSSSKLKLFNASSMMCRKTVMVHPQGIQISQLCPLPEEENSEARFFAFVSEERLGLIMLPLDGDPLKTTNLIAHPSGPRGVGKASALATSADGQYVFTAGGPDTAVHMWKVNTKILEENVAEKQDVRQRFYSMIPPELLHDMKDYFYYSMLRTQGIKCLDTRHTSMTIPIDEISYVMRAIGFYPTEMEVDSMINEIKYASFDETGNYVEDIDLDTFIQMYCNHRPFEGVCRQHIEQAFDTLCDLHNSEADRNSAVFSSEASPAEQKCIIPTVNLIAHLQSLGEPLDDEELVDCLAIQMGVLPEGGRSEAAIPVDDDDVIQKMKLRLPDEFSVDTFIKNVLGMEFCDKVENSIYKKPLKLRSEVSSRDDSAVQTD